MSRSFLKRSTLCRGFNSLCFIASARYQMDNRTGNSPHQSWSASISVLIKQVSIRHRPMFSTGACYRGGPEIDTYDNQPVLVCITTTTFSQSRPNISLFNQIFVVIITTVTVRPGTFAAVFGGFYRPFGGILPPRILFILLLTSQEYFAGFAPFP